MAIESARDGERGASPATAAHCAFSETPLASLMAADSAKWCRVGAQTRCLDPKERGRARSTAPVTDEQTIANESWEKEPGRRVDSAARGVALDAPLHRKSEPPSRDSARPAQARNTEARGSIDRRNGLSGPATCQCPPKAMQPAHDDREVAGEKPAPSDRPARLQCTL